MMLKPVVTKLMSLPILAHAGLSGAALIGLQLVKAPLDANYAASGYPASFAVGQLAFDHRLLEGYYATMRDAGTIDIYWRTQFIDFGFLASVGILGLVLGSLVARAGASGSWTRRFGIAAAYAAVIGASFDALENLMSFVLLSFANAIPQVLVLCYSSAAALKFAAMGTAPLLILLAVTCAAAGTLRRFAPSL